MSLFKKVAMATDLHFGAKGNSRIFNDDLVDFFEWFIKEAKQKQCETCILLGDWHDSRSTINVLTLNYSVRVLRMLSESFENVYILTGNHDLFYREKREIHSLPMGNDISNLHIIDKPTEIGDCLILPWLVDDEWKKVIKSKAKYIFSHLELPGYMLNAMVEMPDHGGLNDSHFKNQDYVFTGHFHKRQFGKNVHYIGNPFGHNFGDAGDKERGACFLEWGGKPEYVNYTNGPVYHNITLSELLDSPDTFATEKAYIKVSVDIPLSYEESLEIRDTFTKQYTVREFKLLPQKIITEFEETTDNIEHFTIDGVVIDAITKLEGETFSTEKLLGIYTTL